MKHTDSPETTIVYKSLIVQSDKMNGNFLAVANALPSEEKHNKAKYYTHMMMSL